jgi:hypothetical protein
LADEPGTARQPSQSTHEPDQSTAAGLLLAFNQRLLASSSATRMLEQWCTERKLAAEPKVRALRDRDTNKAASADVRKSLAVGDSEPLAYRRVKLVCGGYVLSEADNWYVPARLTPAMNAQLDQTDTPFGIVVQTLHFSRRTTAVRELWRAMPMQDASSAPPIVLEHEAVLTTPDGQPFSLVVERYTRELLAPAAL